MEPTSIDRRAEFRAISFTRIVELKPGASLNVVEKDFSAWYEAREAATYNYVGVYRLAIFAHPNDLQPAWEEYMGASVALQFVEK